MTCRVSLLLLTALICSASSFPSAVDRYAGEWVLNRDASDNIDKAIESTIAPMSFVARPIARAKLKRRMVAFPHMKITVNGEGLRVEHQQGMTVLYPAQATAVHSVAPDGASVVSRAVLNSNLEISYDTEDGQRVDEYSLSADGSEVTLHAKVTSPKLPSLLSYKMVFTRAGH